MQNNFYNIDQEVVFRHTLNGNTGESLIRKGKITGIKDNHLIEITFRNGEITYLSKRKLSLLELR